tara:strand:+ start:145 stop:276 length:132 start_codon:yes stop_codon:yes gene_type:complete
MNKLNINIESTINNNDLGISGILENQISPAKYATDNVLVLSKR